jgi:hypothetical protein
MVMVIMGLNLIFSTNNNIILMNFIILVILVLFDFLLITTSLSLLILLIYVSSIICLFVYGVLFLVDSNLVTEYSSHSGLNWVGLVVCMIIV